MEQTMNTQKNYGLIIEKPEPEAWVFGSANLPSYATREILQPSGDWREYLPLEEKQMKFGVESQGCVSYTLLSICEMLIHKKYNLKVNFADRFLAKVSETTRNGNSPQRVAETLRKVGVPKEEAWPFTENINSWDKFYAPIPPKLYELAREFLNEWNFKHYIVPSNPEAIQDALQFSPLGISVAAWTEGKHEVYQQRGQDNHFTTCYASNDFGKYYNIFDSYDSFLKKYSHEAKPAIVKGFYIGDVVSTNWIWDLLKAFRYGR